MYIHVYRILPVILDGPWVITLAKPSLEVLGSMDLWSPSEE